MENVTDRVSNPFDFKPPARFLLADGGPESVPGYGDANADFHVIGDHAGVHGGQSTGVPFTTSLAGQRLQRVLHDAGFLKDEYADAPVPDNLYLNYLFFPRLPTGATPTEEDYWELERYFDSELRAINAHILLPVGETAIDHVVREYTTLRHRFPDSLDVDAMHAMEIRGRGFMVVPIKDPAEWEDEEEAALRERLLAILDSDYRQTKGVATLVG
ncbi:uracil-DNA glycosylase family protein [Haloarchaeobius sp. DYHT-AS-18]|uniref:uracil-DNA glycosylase family protein n=1 Tax=Haloarchaeobius sp. DYHT-AS-18 TaxID=3446117 RepID=UPI003EBEB502